MILDRQTMLTQSINHPRTPARHARRPSYAPKSTLPRREKKYSLQCWWSYYCYSEIVRGEVCAVPFFIWSIECGETDTLEREKCLTTLLKTENASVWRDTVAPRRHEDESRRYFIQAGCKVTRNDEFSFLPPARLCLSFSLPSQWSLVNEMKFASASIISYTHFYSHSLQLDLW